MDFQMLLSQAGVGGLLARAQTTLAGFYQGRFEDIGDGRLRGWGLMMALGSGIEYSVRDLGNAEDAVGSADLIGLRLLVDANGDAGSLRLAIGSYYALSLVQSLSYIRYRDDYDGAVVESSLADRGYYYAHTWTSLAVLRLRRGVLEAGMDARFALFTAIDARDRYVEKVNELVSPSDQRAAISPWLGVRLLRGLAAGVRLDEIHRKSAIRERETSAPERRVGIWVTIGS
jgi:hypothetical protein